MFTIAKKQYNNSLEWKKIHEANKALIGGNPNLIKAGQVIKLP